MLSKTKTTTKFTTESKRPFDVLYKFINNILGIKLSG